MKYLASILVIILSFMPVLGQEVKMPVQYEELSAVQFIEAVEKSNQTVILPMGILEKHGAHLPLGTDLLDARELALRAARQEYTVVFPPYYFGQIFEAMHQPGTIAYRHETIWNLLQETCDELARNGFKKIVIVNGHGGNNSFLRYFGQVQLEKKRDYALYLFTPEEDEKTAEKIRQMRKTPFDGHAGEEETSTMMAHRPDIVHPEVAGTQSGEDQNRLHDLKNAYTGIWWYAKFPNHYAGDGRPANKELGELVIQAKVDQLVTMLRSVKADKTVMELQNRFFDESQNPLKTEQ